MGTTTTTMPIMISHNRLDKLAAREQGRRVAMKRAAALAKQLVPADEQECKVVHVRVVKQHDGNQRVTRVEGLDSDLDLTRISEALTSFSSCTSSVVQDEASGPVLQLAGDQRVVAQQFLTDKGVVNKQQLVLHD